MLTSGIVIVRVECNLPAAAVRRSRLTPPIALPKPNLDHVLIDARGVFIYGPGPTSAEGGAGEVVVVDDVLPNIIRRVFPDLVDKQDWSPTVRTVICILPVHLETICRIPGHFSDACARTLVCTESLQRVRVRRHSKCGGRDATDRDGAKRSH